MASVWSSVSNIVTHYGQYVLRSCMAISKQVEKVIDELAHLEKMATAWSLMRACVRHGALAMSYRSFTSSMSPT